VGSAISALVQPGWICFDIGAHFGHYTLLMARLAGVEGQIHAFEPVPFNLTILQENARRNNIAHIVRIHPLALANATGTARFRASNAPRESGQGFLVGLGPADLTWAQRRFSEFPVEQRRLDDVRRDFNIPPPQLIKIDVEGAEVDVLRGAVHTIRAVRPALIVEVHSEFNAAVCAIMLGELGYTLSVQQRPREPRPQIIAFPPGSPATTSPRA
jgi:FkbM family methyltransferase